MDPLTATLAIISLATALKDIVELAQQLRDAFDKVPHNYRNARQLAQDVLEFSQDIEKLYEEEQDVFERKPRLKKSVEDLLRAMDDVYRQCIKLLPPKSEKKRDRFKIGLYAFWNRDKVTSLVSELKARTDRCYIQFTVASTIRLEADNIELKANVDRIAFSVQSLTTVTTNTAYSAGNAQLFQFAGSYCLPMTWMRGTIPDRDLPRNYIRWQLGITRESFEPFMLKWFESPPEALLIIPDAIHRNSMNDLRKGVCTSMVFHDEAITTIVSFRKMIGSTHPSAIVKLFQQWNLVLNALADCGMYEECAAIMEWRVVTWRTIFPSYMAKYCLAHYLYKYATSLFSIHKYEEALICLREGEDLAHELSLQQPKSHWHLILMARNAKLHARIARSLKKGGNPSELYNRALDFAEQYFIHHASSALATPNGPILNGVFHSQSSAACLLSDISAKMANGGLNQTHIYSSILFDIANILEGLAATQEKADEVLSVEKRVLDILRFLIPAYPDSSLILWTMGRSLLCMASNMRASTQERLQYAKECGRIYRQLVAASQSHPDYLDAYTKSHAQYQWLLLSAGQYCEDDDVLQEFENFARVAPQKYFTMSLPSKAQGNYFFHLAEVHRRKGRIHDAIGAAQNALAQYSGLQFIGSKDYDAMSHLQILALLCRLHFQIDQNQPALLEGKKTINLMTDQVRKEKNMSVYGYLLDIFIDIVHVFANLSQGPVSGTLKRVTPSLHNFQLLFASELSNEHALEIYFHALMRESTLAFKNARHHDFENAINLANRFMHLPNIPNLKAGLVLLLINNLSHHGRFQEALETCYNIKAMVPPGCFSVSYHVFIQFYIFWCQIYLHMPQEAIHSSSKISQNHDSPSSYYAEDLAIALCDSGRSEDALAQILAARKKGTSSRYTWLATELYFSANKHTEARSMLNEEGSTYFRKTAANYPAYHPAATLMYLGGIIVEGLVYCCSGEHTKGLDALAAFSEYIKSQISDFGTDFVPLIRKWLEAEQKRGKWRLIETSARATLQCNHMDQILSGNWAEIAGL